MTTHSKSETKPKIDSTQVVSLAKLARLELTLDEQTRYAEQLSQVLGYVEKLEEIDLEKLRLGGENISPLYQPMEREPTTRPDVVVEPARGEKGPLVLESAPEVSLSSYQVPPVL